MQDFPFVTQAFSKPSDHEVMNVSYHGLSSNDIILLSGRTSQYYTSIFPLTVFILLLYIIFTHMF